MDIDFTGQIKKMKEKDVLHKPFPTGDGYALFAKKEAGGYVKVLFSSEEQIKKYLNHLGYDWGNEGEKEYTNFDSQHRLLKVLPELSEVDSIAADPQWDPDKAPVETVTKHTSDRTMEDIKHCAVELREVDHSVTPVSNHPAHNEKLHASSDESEAKKPDFLKKKGDKKDDKKGDKKNGKKGDEEEKDKNGKKLPPWLNKKKSKSKDYSELYKKVGGNTTMPWLYGFEVGDKVRNVNQQCKHYKSEGTVKKIQELDDDAGFTVGYTCSNAGKNWSEGDLLFKTPDQLEKLDQAGAPCGPGGCFY